jgi:hypothetical protein
MNPRTLGQEMAQPNRSTPLKKIKNPNTLPVASNWGTNNTLEEDEMKKKRLCLCSCCTCTPPLWQEEEKLSQEGAKSTRIKKQGNSLS